MLNDKTRANLESALSVQRDLVLAEIAEHELEGQESLSDVSGENNYRDHMADQGSATFARELDMSLEDNARDMLKHIDAALARLGEGIYGVCVRCAKEIPLERLQAMPTADLCITCKEWEETR